ncbi:hypothetical protein CDN99_19050 [Roseateles aquatilis]|uniref:Uncharacterized protein n=1 Tax=Roseateles aquatilis TaxID=431061 RepID=A0A246J2J8_9BURK|nr:hypothetical protein [Roseateles aquatilis]OWQ86816.1 hypothetical protein CDN99_19050 [Roseateles aquatilis]
MPPFRPVGDSSSLGSQEPFINRLIRLLTDTTTPHADLRDLPRGDLDAMPDGLISGVLKTGKPDVPTPSRLALPTCSAATINRFLRELPDLEICSVEAIAPDDGMVDLTLGPRLRLFETPQPSPRLLNAPHVPVLRRPSCSPPTFLPRVASPLAGTPAGCVEGLRLALAREDHQLELAQARDFFLPTRDCRNILDRARRRLNAGLPALTVPEASYLAALLRRVPRELLPAHAAVLVERMEKRLTSACDLPTLRERHVERLSRLFDDLRDVACPRVHGGLRSRSSEDLTTLAQMWLWAWPDSKAYARPAPLPDEQKHRHASARCLKNCWEKGTGMAELRDKFLELGVPLPNADLLRRMRLPSGPRPVAHPLRWRP